MEGEEGREEVNAVNHPAHYTAYPVEVIDIIRMVLGIEGFKAFCFGNELKYRLRAGLKGDAAEDMAKAMKYKEFRDRHGWARWDGPASTATANLVQALFEDGMG